MKYAKPIMSITELVEMGYSRADLKKAAHHRLAPKYIVRGGGKFLFDTEAWERNKRYVLGR